MPAGLKRLEARIAAATGADRKLDAEIHKAACGARADDVPGYTASVDACLALIHARLPAWRWHVGYDPRGILPYVVLTHDLPDEGARVEMAAPTVPLALLGALVKALRMEDSAKGT